MKRQKTGKTVDQASRKGQARFDAAGRSIALAQQGPIRPAIACFELHCLTVDANGPVLPIFEIELQVRLDTYPYIVIGGSIGGQICSTLGRIWRVTEGSFGTDLALHAELEPLAIGVAERVAGVFGINDCASTTIDISGVFQAPDSYAGPYGFDGSPFEFTHVTLFKGWRGCS